MSYLKQWTEYCNKLRAKKANSSANRQTLSLVQLKMNVGLLKTHYEREQEPHLDYSHKQIKTWKANSSFPYSLDMPLGAGGMKLLMYGPGGDCTAGAEGLNKSIEKGLIYKRPELLIVPFKFVLMWR